MSDFSFIANAHPSFIETMYEKYQADHLSVDGTWASFFKGFEYAKPTNGNGASHASGPMDKEFGVMSIIHGFRDRGHLLSTTNPIRQRRDRKPHLDLADYKLSDADLKSTFAAGSEIGLENATLQQILDRLKDIYAGNIGFEYAHIENRAKRTWLRKKIEEKRGAGYGLSLIHI